jgi:hypothetical protein
MIEKSQLNMSHTISVTLKIVPLMLAVLGPVASNVPVASLSPAPAEAPAATRPSGRARTIAPAKAPVTVPAWARGQGPDEVDSEH